MATQPGTYTHTARYSGATQTFQIQVDGSTANVQLKSDGDLAANGSSKQTVTVTALDASGTPVLNENGTVVVSPLINRG